MHHVRCRRSRVLNFQARRLPRALQRGSSKSGQFIHKSFDLLHSESLPSRALTTNAPNTKRPSITSHPIVIMGVNHIVMFQFKPDASPQSVKQVPLRALVSLPSLRH